MEDAKKVIAEGELLHHPASFWQQFIKKDGSLDKEKLVKNGYDGEGQVEWIEGEMVERGWLSEATPEPKKAGTKKKS